MTARWVAFLTWAAVAAGSMFWILKLAAAPMPLPAHAQVATAGPRLSGDLQRVLGADAPASEAPSEAAVPPSDPRFTLLGVVAPRPGTSARQGLALIAVDDQPAKAFRVGAVVDGSLVLLAVSSRGASLGPRGGPPSVVLELPEMPGPATGVPGAAEDVPGVAPVAEVPTRVPGLPPGLQKGRPLMPVPSAVPALPPAQSDSPPRPPAAGMALPRTP